MLIDRELRGVDGSRQVTALVDPTGTGKSFQSATVTKNGDEASRGASLRTLQLTIYILRTLLMSVRKSLQSNYRITLNVVAARIRTFAWSLSPLPEGLEIVLL